MSTLKIMAALRGRGRYNPSGVRGRSTDNYEQRLEPSGGGWTCTVTSVEKDNLVVEVYDR